MVQNSGKALRANTLRPVNLPEPLKVEEDSSGLPLAVIISSLNSLTQSSSAAKNSLLKMRLPVKNAVAKMLLPVKNSAVRSSLPVTNRAVKQAAISGPQPIPAKAGIHGIQSRSSGRQPVVAIEDRWRIDDEWWRNEPVSRFYYSVRFTSGQRLVLYKDLIHGKWYKQGY